MFDRTAAPAAWFPSGRVGYAIGDIHGRADLLEKLLTELEARAGEDLRENGKPVLIFLGDYVDRGPDSAKVIDLLLQDRPEGAGRRFLKGNHEQSMLAFLEDPIANAAWLRQGGAETLLSYGVQPPAPVGAQERDLHEAAQQLKANLPAEHVVFFNRLERYVEMGDYVFVHAGVDAGRALEDQTDADLYWIRDRFLTSKRRFSHRVVHGHTPAEAPYADERRIGVDTGAYASGMLTAARFEADRLSFVSVRETPAAAAAEAVVF